MQDLRQSTAATISIGPCLDSSGVEYTGLVIGDLSLRKHDGSEAALASAATLTHISNGVYTLVTTTGNTDTIGRWQVRCNKSTYQIPPYEAEVLHANVYDVKYGSVALASTTNITASAGAALAANQHVIVDSGTVTTVTNQLTAAQIATGVWTDTTASDFTTSLSVGKSVMNGVTLGTGLTVNDLTTKTGFSISGTITTLDGLKTNILTTALTESYAADGVAPTLSQFMFMIWADAHEFTIIGTTVSAKKLDSTEAFTHTLDSATSPTSKTRAS